MTVNELLELLTEIADGGGGDFEVMMSTKPSRSWSHALRGVVSEDDKEKVVWLVEGSSPRRRGPYAPKQLWDLV